MATDDKVSKTPTPNCPRCGNPTKPVPGKDNQATCEECNWKFVFAPELWIVQKRLWLRANSPRGGAEGYTIIVPYSQAASVNTPNLLAGLAPEYMGEAVVLTIYGSADLATARDQVTLTSFRGSTPGKLHIPQSQVPLASTAGSIKTNESFMARVAVEGGSRLVMSLLSDATAGTHTGRFMLVVE